MYSKYKALQNVLKKLVIRWKEGSYTDANGDVANDAVVVDISGEMKLRDFTINDTTLLSVDQKDKLEKTVLACFQKAQTKAQEVVAEKTKEVLWFDPSNMWAMMWGGGIPGMS